MHSMHKQLCSKPRSFQNFVHNLQSGYTIFEEVYLSNIKASEDQAANLFATYFSSLYVELCAIPIILLNTYTTYEFSFLPFFISVSIVEAYAELDPLSTIRGAGPDDIATLFFCIGVVTYSAHSSVWFLINHFLKVSSHPFGNMAALRQF